MAVGDGARQRKKKDSSFLPAHEPPLLLSCCAVLQHIKRGETQDRNPEAQILSPSGW